MKSGAPPEKTMENHNIITDEEFSNRKLKEVGNKNVLAAEKLALFTHPEHEACMAERAKEAHDENVRREAERKRFAIFSVGSCLVFGLALLIFKGNLFSRIFSLFSKAPEVIPVIAS